MNLINFLVETEGLGETIKFCEHYSVLTVFYFIKQIITLVSIFVPIVLIIMMGVDVLKIVISGDVSNEFKKYGSIMIKRTVMAIAFFLVPIVISLVAQLIGFVNYDASKCWTDANKETITRLKDEQKAQANEQTQSSEENN